MTPLFLVSLIVTGILTAVFLPAALGNQWLSFRDPFFITENPMVVLGQPIVSTCLSQHIWMPLPFFIYRLEFLVAGLNPVVFHLVNVFFHVVGVIFIGLTAMRFVANSWVIFGGMIFYGLLPMHANSVGSASGLPDLIANALMPISFYAGLKYTHKTKKRWLITAIVSVLCLGFSKPLASLFPNVVFMVLAAACMLVAVVANRFDVFLKTQEKIIRILYWAALGCLLMVMSVIAYERSLWWKNDLTLWQHVTKAKPTAAGYMQLAFTMQKSLKPRPDKAAIDAILQCYDKAQTLSPKEPMVDLERASFLIRLGQIDKAKTVYQHLLKREPHQLEAMFGLAQIEVFNHNPGQVIALINDIVKQHPDDENVFLKAITLYGKAIDIYPSETIFKEKREELLDGLSELSKRKKYTATDFYNLALLYQQVGGREEAVRYYQKVLQLNPNHELSLYNLALLTQSSGDLRGALGIFSKLVRVNPKMSKAYLNMGLIYSSLSDPIHARSMFLKVISLDPNNSSAFFNLGYIVESQGDLKQAMEYYEKAVELDPKNAEAYYNLGNVYANQGLSAEAMASYLKTIDIDPKHVNALVNLSIISFKARDIKGAIFYLEKAQTLGYTPPEEFLKVLKPYMKK